jgi:N-acetylneuraminic acid mutarotase
LRKAIVTIILLFAISAVIIVEPASASDDYWVARAPIPVAMNVYGLADINGQIYAFGVDDHQKALTYAYNPKTDSWTLKTPMPTSRVRFTIAQYQDKVYAIGGITGYDSSSGKSLITGTNEMYDAATDTWTTKASMPTPRTSMQANTVNGKIYVISGLVDNLAPSGPALTDVTEVYDPTNNSWTIAAPISTPVFSYASAVLDNKIYIVGGEKQAGEQSPFTTALQIYDVDNNSWSTGKSLPVLTVQAVSGATTGVNAPKRIYVIGGRLNGPIDATQIYDPAIDEWTSGAAFPTTHDYVTEYLAAANVNDTIFTVGGIAQANEGFYELTEQYVPTGYNGTIIQPQPSTTESTSPSPSPSVAELQWWIAPAVLLTTATLIALLTKWKRATRQ